MEATRSDLGGTWGEAKRKQLGLGATVSSLTTNKSSFGDHNIKAYTEKSMHPGAKFSRMKESKNMILSYKDSNVHFGEKSQSSMEGEEFGHIDANAIGASAERGPSEKHMARTRKLILSDCDAPIAVWVDRAKELRRVSAHQDSLEKGSALQRSPQGTPSFSARGCPVTTQLSRIRSTAFQKLICLTMCPWLSGAENAVSPRLGTWPYYARTDEQAILARWPSGQHRVILNYVMLTAKKRIKHICLHCKHI